jgi:hypothetical protein
VEPATGSHGKLNPAEGHQDANSTPGLALHIVHGDVGESSAG